jgi:Cu-processing system ATP-binding protein
VIAVKNLHKSFGSLNVLDGLDIQALDQGIFAILGPNGSGKTTLIKCILGMVIPDKGSIQINGKEVLGEWAYRGSISYMPQIANFPPNLKVIELINMIKSLRPEAIHEEALIETFGLKDSLEKKLVNLSGGTKQKVNIVLTFMSDSPLIILDEPTTGLDPLALTSLKQLILQERDKGKTILITSHIMSFIEEMADEVVFLLEGNIFFNGTIDSLMKQTKARNLELAISTIIQNSND